MENQMITLNGGTVRQTEKAILFMLSDMVTEIWLPKSQIQVEDKFTVQVPVWLAEEKISKGQLLSLTN